jgi:hypothetical protein|tara:strand:- start:11462 stop:11890 length:429 start_codon:yes stop_codon:yes gene_type:complete
MGLFKDCGCGCNGKKQEEKFILSIISAMTFYVVANPMTFRLVRGVLGNVIASPNGCPTTFGLVIHALVFMLIVWGMMNIKKDTPSCAHSKSKKSKAGTKTVVPSMAEAPNPMPGFKETKIPLNIDTGKVLESFEIGVDGGLF